MIGYIAGGAAIGGLAGGAALGVSAIGGAAWWAGAAAGAVSGAGFNGLATNWNGAAMLKGACIGALAGFVGGGVSSAIGGGWDAVAGGSTSSGVSTSLSGGDIGQIGVSMLIGGAMAYGTYELTSYMSYKDADLPHTNYKQFKTMQADYQRSRFWRKEYGGILYIVSAKYPDISPILFEDEEIYSKGNIVYKEIAGINYYYESLKDENSVSLPLETTEN